MERHNRGPVADMVDAATESRDLAIPYTAAVEADSAAPDAIRSAARDGAQSSTTESKSQGTYGKKSPTCTAALELETALHT